MVDKYFPRQFVFKQLQKNIGKTKTLSILMQRFKCTSLADDDVDGDEIGLFICNNKNMLTLVLFDVFVSGNCRR